MIEHSINDFQCSNVPSSIDDREQLGASEMFLPHGGEVNATYAEVGNIESLAALLREHRGLCRCKVVATTYSAQAKGTSYDLLNIVRRSIPHDVNLPNQHRETDHHCDSNDGQVDPRKFKPANTDMLSSQDIAPQHTSKRCAERQAESAVIYTNSHAVHRAPEGSVRDVCAVLTVDFLPGLYDSREQDCGADVCPGELHAVSRGF